MSPTCRPASSSARRAACAFRPRPVMCGTLPMSDSPTPTIAALLRSVLIHSLRCCDDAQPLLGALYPQCRDELPELLELLPDLGAELLGRAAYGLGAGGGEALDRIGLLHELRDFALEPHDDGA